MKSSSKKTSGETVHATLRSYAKYRILNDMINNARLHTKYSKDYLILIMDSSALKVFSSCCKYFDVF